MDEIKNFLFIKSICHNPCVEIRFLFHNVFMKLTMAKPLELDSVNKT